MFDTELGRIGMQVCYGHFMNFRAERRPQSYGPIVEQTAPDANDAKGRHDAQ